MATLRADSQAAADAAAAAAAAAAANPSTLSSYTQQTGRSLPSGIISAPGSILSANVPGAVAPTTTPLSTNDKNAAIIAEYAAAHPAGPHQHYGTTLNPDGTPRLYWDMGWTAGPDGKPYQPLAGGGSKGTKQVVNVVNNPDGTATYTYDDGTTGTGFPLNPDGTFKNSTNGLTSNPDDSKQQARQSAYDLLQQEFTKYGLGDLVAGIKGLITDATVNPSEISLRLRQTPAYQQRFSANADRVKAGLTELTPAEYVGLEDQYQKIMQNYGLPASYYTVGQYGKQSGFDKLLAGDVSAKELEDRIATAQQRVVNANPDVLKALKSFYPDITNGDILAYTLDPKNALDMIHRKVTAAEIGGAALNAGLDTNANRAELLASYGITGQQYSQNAQTIAQTAQRGSQLAGIYGQTPYGQTQAEQEALNLAGGTEAAAARKKLTSLETANFSGQSGTASNAFSRERAMSPMMLGVPGAGAF